MTHFGLQMPHFASRNTQHLLKTAFISSLLHKNGCGSAKKQVNLLFCTHLAHFFPQKPCTIQINALPLQHENPPSLSTMLNRRQTESNVKLVWTLPRCEGGRDFLKLKCAGRFLYVLMANKTTSFMLKKAQTATIILPGLPQPPIIYGEVCANGATSRWLVFALFILSVW